jgi:ATP-dependent helicase/nuclease subunit A
MKPLRAPPEETLTRQLTASDPRASAWVSANAGSGKTTVLTRRVIRLLLEGAAPAAILCLTFTKAAAANMQNRIFEMLGSWAALEDDALAGAIEAISGARPGEAGLTRARRLFAGAVETPGGLKVLTIHAFCEKILHLFPFEANVPAQFSVLDDRGAEELLTRARRALVAEALAKPETSLGRAMGRIVEDAGEGAFDDLLGEVMRRREAIKAVFAGGDCSAVAARVRRLLDLDAGEDVEELDRSLEHDGLAVLEWPMIAKELASCGQSAMMQLAQGFLDAHAASGENRCDAYRRIFLTQKGEPKKADRFLNQSVKRQSPLLAERLLAELDRVGRLEERRRRAATAERTAALVDVAGLLLDAYERAKRARAALDFEDLVGRTLSLLQRAGADWVLYKLDRGIDHILVDEAQDTSPTQWEIVRLLAQEFTAGAGARGALERTVFAVGDEKQSIFSFQGAAPAEFARMRSHFRNAFTQAGLAFAPVELTHSFRSTRDVLAAVDAVFADSENRRGLSSDDVGTHHETVRSEEPGRVEIWPIVKPDPAPPLEAWDAPFDETPSSSPVARAAARIAAAVKTLIRDGDAETGARYRAGDIMVLVRSRNAIFEAVIRALKREGVPVAGADRIILADHIAVMDLVALARFTLLPSDDLTLATVLKTPLVGLDDGHLVRLAPERKGSLWDALRDSAHGEPCFHTAHQRLQAWIDEAAFKTPFAFFSDVLARDGGRRAFLARLGMEATDALDEFLGAAIDYERAHTPSLEGFLAWLAEARAEVKRDMDVARGEVRVMTVHGAKGLEAKVVVMADCCGAPNGMHDPKLFFVPDPHGPSGSRLLLWSPSAGVDAPATSHARAVVRAEADAEHRRLLYVAMTRAEDRLILAGHQGTRARPDGNWHDMVERSLRAAGARAEAFEDGERLVFEVTPRNLSVIVAEEERSSVDDSPSWLREAAPQEPERVAMLKPSEAMDEVEISGSRRERGDDGAAASERGRLVHRLLQSLPDVAPQARREAALRYLARAMPGHEGEHQRLAMEALAILDHPDFAPVFLPGGRSEVPIVGRLQRTGRPDVAVSGRIDRLCVDEARVLIVDFKTNRTPPAVLADVPRPYVLQLALYRALLSRLYRGRRVEAALVWTSSASLMPIPGDMMDRVVETVLG